MQKDDAAAIEEIKALEDRRYRAMLAYLHKVETRYFTYLEITHPADRILVVDGAALVTGRMTRTR